MASMVPRLAPPSTATSKPASIMDCTALRASSRTGSSKPNTPSIRPATDISTVVRPAPSMARAISSAGATAIPSASSSRRSPRTSPSPAALMAVMP